MYAWLQIVGTGECILNYVHPSFEANVVLSVVFALYEILLAKTEDEGLTRLNKWCNLISCFQLVFVATTL